MRWKRLPRPLSTSRLVEWLWNVALVDEGITTAGTIASTNRCF
jgi:hypothetical protein